MRFLLNESVVDVPGSEPSMTLLRYLRTRAGLTGTKEGCASGDCGACTVLVDDRAVNACIAPLGSVAGRRVVTVEGLGEPGRLHPVQQALVDADASQCGFCTPGFAMALASVYAEHRGAAAPSRDEVIAGIAGNLCRCTGYRPIVAAGLAMFDAPTAAAGAHEDLPEPGRLAGYERPTTEAELRRCMREHPHAPLVAGGTDFMLEVTQRYWQFDALIDLSAVTELCRVEETDADWWIGAAAPLRELESFFADRLPELVRLLARFGSRQIRHCATLGGNLANASPIADLPPLLLVLDAEIAIRDASGAERGTSVDRFYRGYKKTDLRDGEYIAGVRIPRPTSGQRVYLYKLSKRFEDDISSVMLAARLGAGEPRIAYGGMAEVPVRALAAEAALRDGLDDAALEAAVAAVDAQLTPIDDVRASAAYRRAMAGNLLRRAAAEQRGEPVPQVFDHA